MIEVVMIIAIEFFSDTPKTQVLEEEPQYINK